jgi:hypothetical protein
MVGWRSGAGTVTPAPNLTRRELRRAMFDDHPTVSLDPIPGFPGYLVCRLGAVFSTRALFGGSRAYPVPLKLILNSKGYLDAGLFRDGRQYRRPVHQLVLETYVGPRPEGVTGEESRHLNDVKTDNRLSNLRWGSRRENNEDKARAGSCKGMRHGNAKLTDDDIRTIRAMRPCDAARRFGITPGHAWEIRARNRWNHVK